MSPSGVWYTWELVRNIPSSLLSWMGPIITILEGLFLPVRPPAEANAAVARLPEISHAP